MTPNRGQQDRAVKIRELRDERKKLWWANQGIDNLERFYIGGYLVALENKAWHPSMHDSFRDIPAECLEAWEMGFADGNGDWNE